MAKNRSGSESTWGDRVVLPDESIFDGLSRLPGDSVKSLKEDYNDAYQYSSFETGAATWFNVVDADGYGDLDRFDWERMQQWHRDTRNNWNGEGMEKHVHQSARYHYSDTRRLAECLCDSVGVNRGERELIVSLSNDIDYQSLGGHSSLEKGILGLIAAVVSSRRSGYLLGGPDSYEERLQRGSIQRQESFKSLMDSFGVESNDLNTIRQLIYEQKPWVKDLGPDTG